MNFVWWVAVTAIGAVVAAAILRASRALWTRRDRLRHWLSKPAAIWRRRRERRAAKSHQRLVAEVLERAEAQGIPLPTQIQRQGDVVTATYHPGGEQRHFVADRALYERMLRREQLPPTRTFVGPGPTSAVDCWSDEELRAWLKQNAAGGDTT
jgi:hypothetical protein